MLMMHILTQNSVFMLLILVPISLSIVYANSSELLPHVDCNSTYTYSSGDAFKTNLNDTLFTQLLPNASTTGFSNFTTGIAEDQVYALFYCKRDVDQPTCQECIQQATRKITDYCKSSKEAIIWFDECTLRYSNRTIFSVVEVEPNFLYDNTTGNVTEVLLDPFKTTFDTTMNSLIQEAAYSKGFATKEFNLSSTVTLRGLAQCSPDIVASECHSCLKTALRIKDTWANTIVFLPSCFFRYDLYKTVTVLPAPSPEPSPKKPNQRGLLIALVAVVSVVFIILAVIVGTWVWNRCSIGDILTGTRSIPNEDDHAVRDMRRVQGLPKYTFVQVKKMTKGLSRELGKGAFGVVYHGQLLDGSGREVAVKLLNETDAPTQFSNEIDVFVRISHNNLVSLLGYCEDGTKLALIYEYMSKGDLRSYFSENARSLTWTDRLKIAIDTAEGLHYLHKSCGVCIVHRDVKPANILLNQQLQAKVADFGLSKIFPERDVTTIETRVIGTHGYRAPEYTATGLLNHTADVYSFGVVLVELITGKGPRFGFDSVKSFLRLVHEGDIEKILDPDLRRSDEPTMLQGLDTGSAWGATELAKTCVEVDSMKRPDMWDIVVKLKECLEIEKKKTNTNEDGGGSTSTEIMMISPLVSDCISMGPERR